jgi:hypothetical protein
MACAEKRDRPPPDQSIPKKAAWKKAMNFSRSSEDDECAFQNGADLTQAEYTIETAAYAVLFGCQNYMASQTCTLIGSRILMTSNCRPVGLHPDIAALRSHTARGHWKATRGVQEIRPKEDMTQ